MRPIVAAAVPEGFGVAGGFVRVTVADVVADEVVLVGSVAFVVVGRGRGGGVRVAWSPDEPHAASATVAPTTRIRRCLGQLTSAW
jgi:hypothetical protein